MGEKRDARSQLPSQAPIQQDVAYLSGWQSAVKAPVSILNRYLSLCLLSFHPHLPAPLLLWERLSFNLAVVANEQDEVDGGVGLSLSQAGGWVGGRLLEVNPWGCSVQGPFSSLSLSVCLGKRRGSVCCCIINEGGRRPVQPCPAAKVSAACLPATSLRV